MIETAIESVKRKINALLRLSENNPNENEARAALLKAQELMGRHLLDESEFQGDVKEEVCELVFAHLMRRSQWIGLLTGVIADAFGCFVFYRERVGEVDYFVAGKKSKVDVAFVVYKAAYKMALNFSKQLNRNQRKSFLLGFSTGLNSGFKKQSQESEWGLVLVMDAETREAKEKMKLGKARSFKSSGLNYDAYSFGRTKGEEFASGQKRGTDKIQKIEES